MSALTGTNRDVIKTNPAFKNEGVWTANTYAEYKAAMKKKLKDQLAARQDMIDKMDPTEYKIYRHRMKALKDARAATKEKREALHAA